MRWRILLVLLALAVAAAAGAGWYYKHETRKRTVTGSSTREFVPQAAPERVAKRPKKLVYVEPWPTYAADPQRTHFSPFDHRPPYASVWRFRAGYYIEFPPTVAYGRVFLSQLRARLFSIDARNGKVLWRKWFRGYCAAASPTVARGIVYEVYVPPPCTHGDRSRPGLIVGIRAHGGRIAWRYRGPASESSPLVVGNLLYFGSWNHRLYAFDIRTHKLRWTFQADAELNAAPAYSGGTIYIGSDGGTLYAVDAKTGRERWSAHSFSRFGRREYFYATPTVAYGRVFVGNTDGTMYAYGASSGDLLWARSIGSYVYTAAAAYRQRIYVGTYDGNVFALDAATGNVRWKHSAPASIHGAPTVMGGLVYFATCGTCGSHGSRYAKRGPRLTFALDALTGRRVWSFPDGRYSPVVADRRRVYVVGNTRLYAFVSRSELKRRRAHAPANRRAPRRRSRSAARSGTSSGTRG